MAALRATARCAKCFDLHIELGRTIYCDDCQRAHRIANGKPGYLAVSALRAKRYDREPHDLQRLVNEAHGSCEICGRTLESKFCIDHNHATGEVRGVLCTPCNQALGFFGDDPDRLMSAALYLVTRGHYGGSAQ